MGQVKEHEYGTDDEEGCQGRSDAPLTWRDAHAGPLLREFPDCYLLRRATETFGSVGRWSAGRGRPPQAATRRPALRCEEKSLTGPVALPCEVKHG